MQLNLTVFGSHGNTATARLVINYFSREATIVPGPGWFRTRLNNYWQIEWSRTQGALYLSNDDTARYGDGHGIKLQACPTSEQDAARLSGIGAIRSTLSREFSTARVEWKIAGRTALRREILGIIQGLGLTFNPADKPNFPNGPPSAALIAAVDALFRKNNPGKEPPKRAKVTNCGEFPGEVLKQVAGDLPADVVQGVKVGTDMLKATGNMTKWKDYALEVEKLRGEVGSIWHPWNNRGELPRPGDVYVLGKTSTSGGEFGHVGIVVSPNGPVWTTADSGQGDGYGCCYQPRAYNPHTGTVKLLGVGSSKFQPDAGIRYLWGWIDVDALFKRTAE